MRVVIKVGSSTLTHSTGKLNFRTVERFVRVMADLKNKGHEIILVSSGAMAVGITKLGLERKPSSTPKKQAVASVGQSELMAIYDKMFSDYGYNVGQILLTRDATENRDRRENVINTFNALLDYGCVPIVNENDSVEVEEIKFGDNDTLSAIVATCVEADILIILSDIHNLCDSDPRKNPNAKPIYVVKEITDEIRALAGDTSTSVGTGGMITKIRAAEIATEKGIPMYIAHGKNPEILYDILDKKQVGTLFCAKEKTK